MWFQARDAVRTGFSCTGLVSEDQCLDTLRRAAYFSCHTVPVLKVSGAGPDHSRPMSRSRATSR